MKKITFVFSFLFCFSFLKSQNPTLSFGIGEHPDSVAMSLFTPSFFNYQKVAYTLADGRLWCWSVAQNKFVICNENEFNSTDTKLQSVALSNTVLSSSGCDSVYQYTFTLSDGNTVVQNIASNKECKTLVDTVINRIVKQVTAPFCDSIRIDSFVFNNGTSFVIADTLQPCEYHGNIMYISTSGNDLTGKKGFEHLPFSANSMFRGADSIIVKPGHYTVANTAIPLGSANMPLYFRSEGNITLLGTGGQAFQFDAYGDTTATIKMNRFNVGSNVGFYSRFGAGMHVDVDYLEQLNTNFRAVVTQKGGIFRFKKVVSVETFASQRFATLVSEKPVVLNIEEAIVSNKDAEFIKVSTSSGGNLNISLKNATFDNCQPILSNAAGGILVPVDVPNNVSTFDLSNIDFRLKSNVRDITPQNAYAPFSSGFQVYGYMSMTGNPGATFAASDTSQLFFDYKNIKSDAPVYIGYTGNESEVKVNLSNAVFKKTRALEIDKRSTNPRSIGNSQTIFLHLDNVICDSSHVISILSEASDNYNIIITGNIRTKGVGVPVIYTNQNLILKDLYIENDGTVPLISAANAVTVTLENVTFSNPLKDPEVSYIGVSSDNTSPLVAGHVYTVNAEGTAGEWQALPTTPSLESGRVTPTVVSTTPNTATYGIGDMFFTRVGDIVTCHGTFNVAWDFGQTPSGGIIVHVDLPVSSDIQTTDDLAGVFTSTTANGGATPAARGGYQIAGKVAGFASTDKASVSIEGFHEGVQIDDTAYEIGYSFSYEVK